MNHGANEAQVNDIEKITRFLQAVESLHLKELADDFIGALIPPRVDVR